MSHFRVDHINEDIQKLREQIVALEKQRDGIIRTCRHQWDNPAGKYVPIETKGYLSLGDLPGVGGADRREDFYVSPTTTPQWQRTCKNCGYVQKTTAKKMIDGGGGLQQEVPSFSEHFS